MNIEVMMLQVLDDPTGVRIVVETKYPMLREEDTNANFLIDRGDCGVHVDGIPERPAVIYDHWQVTDSFGQAREFNSNVELMEFIESIDSIIFDAYVEGF